MNSKLIGLVVVALIATIGYGLFARNKADLKSTPLPTPEISAVSSVAPSYRDGIYDKIGDYVSPGGPEQIEVKLTLKNGIVVDSEVTAKAERPISKMRQAAFVDGYKQEVVGKNINDLNLGRISGSSLTPQGFNDAVEKIKAEAKVS